MMRLMDETAATVDALANELREQGIALPKVALDQLGTDMTAFLTTLAPLVADPVTHRQEILDQADDLLDAAVALLERAARFRLPSAGWGSALDWRHSAFARDIPLWSSPPWG